MFTAGWPDIHIAALKERHASGMSFALIAADINATFGTSYSRCACIGKARRIGLTSADKPQAKREPERREPFARPPRKPRVFTLLPELTTSEAAAECAQITSRRVSLYDLSDDTCRWPISSPDQPDFCFCGNTPLAGLPYCGGHCRLAYRAA